jgi:hypothetical protein
VLISSTLPSYLAFISSLSTQQAAPHITPLEPDAMTNKASGLLGMSDLELRNEALHLRQRGEKGEIRLFNFVVVFTILFSQHRKDCTMMMRIFDIFVGPFAIATS